MEFHAQLPLSLYVHYPWCVQKCPYCDFNSHHAQVDLAQQESRYLDALIRQLETVLPWVWGRPIQSIFFGGGTPSLMSVTGFERLLSELRALLGFGGEIEITLEANPGTVDEAKFAGFFQAGANRLSIGIQSFDSTHLCSLGRIHDANQAWSAIQVAQRAGFDNINLDLMFGLPQQTLAQALADVERALEAEPQHISHYQLTLEPNTPFYRNPPVLPDEDLIWDMQLACQTALRQGGFEHYEVSAFAQPGKSCRHNLNYWRFGDYIGLGAGAHGKLTMPQTPEVLRSQMPASPGGYVQMVEQTSGSAPIGRWHSVDEADLVFEFMLNALRLQKGFELSLFSQTTGLPIERIQPQLQALVRQNWIVLYQERLELTPQGHTYLNSLIETFLP